MGMYTELILGCKLSKDAPEVLTKALDAVINHYIDEKHKVSKEVEQFIEDYSLVSLFWCSSYYFGVNHPNSAFWFDTIDQSWHISSRSNLKNYEDEIETFLNYLSPYVEYGSGTDEVYAYVMYEESKRPTVYSLKSIEDYDDR